jgi:hypothetical protein
MTETNPQIEKQLDALADLCCAKLAGDMENYDDRSEALLSALLKSGYLRKTGHGIQAELEARVKKLCRYPAMHRGGALSGITSRLQNRFDQLAKWESKKPDSRSKAKAANISSATDA